MLHDDRPASIPRGRNSQCAQAEPRDSDFVSWGTGAALISLTGGTTAAPRMVHYDVQRWRRSVSIKCEIFRAHGVGPGSRVVVCHPSDPWAIGGVHRDAALACGASVLPLGLNAGSSGLQRLLVEFRPTVLCGTASLLSRWKSELDARQLIFPLASRRVVFHAGEPLRDEDRRRCAAAWRATVVNVYGLAEFDAVASETPDGQQLALAPAFDFGIRIGQDVRVAALGQSGELFVRERAAAASWVSTRDRVHISGTIPHTSRLWPGSLAITLLGRLDGAVPLPDGSVITHEQVESADRMLGATRHTLTSSSGGSRRCRSNCYTRAGGN